MCVLEEYSMVTTEQAVFTAVANGRPFTHTAVRTDEMAKLSVHAIFQARPSAVISRMLEQMDRQDRRVLILLDGRRTIQDITRLLHKSEVEVAQVLVHLLKNGHIDYMGTQKA